MNTAITFARKRIDVRYLVLATLAAACMGVSSTAVHAADDSEPMKTTVRYADLNLANPQGVEQLYQRIVSAARQVCSAADGRTLQEKAQLSPASPRRSISCLVLPPSAVTLFLSRRFSRVRSAAASLSAVASRRRSLTSSEVAARAVSPARRFLPASRKSFDQR